MTDTAPSPTRSGKSSLIVAGVALAIVIIVFAVIGLGQGDADNATGPVSSPVVQPNQPHDESVPHTH